jgi:hypothetical protein
MPDRPTLHGIRQEAVKRKAHDMESMYNDMPHGQGDQGISRNHSISHLKYTKPAL